MKAPSIKVPLLKSVMTPFPYSIEAGDPASDALLFMREHDIRHLPVREAGLLVGIVSERDILVALNASNAERMLLVREIFRNHAYAVDIETSLSDILRQMALLRSGATLVTRQDKLVGIFTTVDACSVLAEMIDAMQPPTDDEAA